MSGAAVFCPHEGGPPMNTDVSGIGVRISFYLQTLLLACLSTRSGSLDEITGAMYTLMATNMAMAVTALILGLKPNPGISLQDGLVIFYLLYLSWVTVFVSLPSCSRFPRRDVKLLKFLSIIQSYTIFAFAFAMLIQAKAFGSHPECNHNAMVVLFRPFLALNAGRIVCWIITVIVVTTYTAITVKDYLPQQMHEWMHNKRIQISDARPIPPVQRSDPEASINANDIPKRKEGVRGQNHINKQKQPPRHHLNIAWDLIIEIIVIFIFWALTVMNTELLIRWNHFEGPDNSQSIWQFGQVLPLFLVVLPLVGVINAFSEFGLRPWRKSIKCDCQSATGRYGRSVDLSFFSTGAS